MPTIQQLIRNKRQVTENRTKSPALLLWKRVLKEEVYVLECMCDLF